MRICCHKQGNGGVAFYRIIQPYDYLKEVGLAETFVFDSEYHSLEMLEHQHEIADVLVYQMPWGEPLHNILEVNKSRKKPKKIVVEFDDNVLTGVNPFNKAYSIFGTEDIDLTLSGDGIVEKVKANMKDYLVNDNGSITVPQWKDGVNEFDLERNRKNRDFTIDALTKVDLVTVTTPELGKVIRKFRPKGPIAILPNLIDSRRWLPMKKNTTDEIRIAWQGGDAHYLDLYQIAPAIDKIMAKYPKVKLVMKGGHFFSLFDQWGDRVEWQPWHGDINTYPIDVINMRADIGIAPLIDDRFNRAKSDLKFLEYGILKLPGVYSDICYKDTVKHGKTGFLAKDNDDWFKYLSELTESKELRDSIADKAYTRVYEHHNINMASRYYKCIEDLLENKTIVVPKKEIIRV